MYIYIYIHPAVSPTCAVQGWMGDFAILASSEVRPDVMISCQFSDQHSHTEACSSHHIVPMGIPEHQRGASVSVGLLASVTPLHGNACGMMQPGNRSQATAARCSRCVWSGITLSRSGTHPLPWGEAPTKASSFPCFQILDPSPGLRQSLAGETDLDGLTQDTCGLHAQPFPAWASPERLRGHLFGARGGASAPAETLLLASLRF